MKQEDGVFVALTDSLKGFMEHYRKQFSKEKYEQFVVWCYDGIQFYKEQFSKIPAGKDRAYNVHRFIDEQINDQKKSNPEEWKLVSCRSGCSACCYKTVVATDDEADLLVEHCKEKGIEIDVEHLTKQAGFNGSASEYFDQPKEVSRCVFLKDEKCSVYEHRPASCRKYFVISDPKFCGGHAGQETMNLVDKNVELAASGAMDIDHKRVGDLPDQLLKRLGVRNESNGLRSPDRRDQSGMGIRD